MLCAGPSRAADGPLKLLEQQTLAESQTVEHHVALGRTARQADRPAEVAEALALVSMLPPQVAPRAIGMVGTELPRLREYLRQRGAQLFDAAMAAHAAGDLKTAVKSYLVSLKCDASLMSRDDRGLGKLGLDALRKMSVKHPERADLKFQLGFYSHLFGDSAAAVAALEAQQQQETDPYKRWRGGLWLRMIQAETAASAPTGTRPGGAIASQP